MATPSVYPTLVVDISVRAMNPVAKPLDDSLFKINDQAYQFMKDQTGISDEEELKQHILAVQAEAYRVSDNVVCLLDASWVVEWSGVV